MQLGLNLGFSQVRRNSGHGGILNTFSPTDLPDLRLWLDVETNVFSSIGNYFTDATASIELNNFPLIGLFDLDPNVTVPNSGSLINNKPTYSINLVGGDWGGLVTVFWDGNNWITEVVEFLGEGQSVTTYTAIGNTDYPWKATWTNGTITRTDTTVDVPADYGNLVSKWGNKVEGYPSMVQTDSINKPLYSNDYNKNIRFTSNHLTQSYLFPQSWGNEWTYYIVSTPCTDNSQSTLNPLYMIGQSSGSMSRGGFGTNKNNLIIRDSNSVLSTTPTVSSGFILGSSVKNFSTNYVFSARVSTSGFTLGTNLTFVTRNIAINSSTSRALSLGSLAGGEKIAEGRMKEVLVYRKRHTDQEALQVISYLSRRWSIIL